MNNLLAQRVGDTNIQRIVWYHVAPENRNIVKEQRNTISQW
eukprot:XP_001709545.1 Hypothetical protein GL50803_10294 [Giardia lamblia ATCC 50803]